MVRYGGCFGFGLAVMGLGRYGMMCRVDNDIDKL